jgi:hypothetical protein
MKSLSKGESAFVLLILLCIGAAGTALFRDFAFAGDLRGVEVGTITWKNRYAEQRQEGSGLWVSAAKDGPVYNHDTIRTGENSSAVIKLANNTEISLEEGSMVYIKVDSGTKKATISLKGGSIKVAQAEKTDSVLLETSSGSIALASGTVRLSGKGNRTTVRPETPGAIIVAKGSDNPVTLDAASLFDVSNQETATPSFSVTEPHPEEVVVTAEKSARVTFAWKPEGETKPLEVALDPAFRKNTVSEPAFASGSSLEFPAGRYWWRIPESGESGSFTVIEGAESAPVSPVGKSFIKAAVSVSIPFSWTKRGEADSYRVDVFAEGSGDEPVLQRTVMQRATTIDFTEAGNYSWTVTSFYGPDRVAFTSARKIFSVVTAMLPAPEAPTVSREIAAWKTVDGADRYELRVSADAEGTVTKYAALTGSPFASLKKTLPDGTWFVAVRAFAGNVISPWSTATRYEISPPKPLVATTPADGASVSLAGKKIFFAWKDANGGSRYRLLVSRTADLSNPIAEASPHRTDCSIPFPEGIQAGNYFWKVSLVDSAGAVTSESPVSSFAVLVAPPAPKPVAPAKGAILEINALDALRFAWESTGDGDSYIVSLYRMTGGIPKLVGSWETDETTLSISDFSKLALDTFSWELFAVRKNGDGTKTKSEPAVSYFRIVQGKLLSVPTIKVMKTRGPY